MLKLLYLSSSLLAKAFLKAKQIFLRASKKKANKS